MKKMFSLIAATTMAISALWLPDFTSVSKADSIVSEKSVGDLSEDGYVDLTDLSMLSLHLVGDMKLSESQCVSADIDNDGEATLLDLAKYRQFISKKISNLIDQCNLATYIPPDFVVNETDTFTVLGDSISAGWAADYVDGSINQHNAEVSAINKLKQLLGNVTVYNHSHGGWSYSSPTNNMLVEAQQANEANHLNTDYLLIMAGTNDFDYGKGKQAFSNALDDLTEYLNENYNGQIIIVTPINRSKEEARIVSLDWYRDTLTNWALQNGYWVIDGSKVDFPTSAGEEQQIMIADGIHPSNYGHIMYANALNKYIHN